MTDALQTPKTEPAGLFNTAINILVSPTEAFIELQQRPRKLFPLSLLLLSTTIASIWYFNIVDFEWYIDDIFATDNIGGDEDDLEQIRETMLSLGPNTVMISAIVAGSVSFFLFYTLQAGYLSLISALTGNDQKFSNWFSLVLWTTLPALLSVAGMMVTIMLSANGQLSNYDLNPLTLRNLGMESSNSSVNTLLTAIDLTMAWSLGLLTMGYKQWLDISIVKAMAVVMSPYLLILVVSAYLALA